MPANSLGFSTEIVRPPKFAAKQACVDVEAASVPSHTYCRGMFKSRESMLCCTLTTLLILSAAGVGTWFAITEM